MEKEKEKYMGIEELEVFGPGSAVVVFLKIW